jgi:hypothetical protein
MVAVKTLRVYADTSVFGGCFDTEFQAESLQFFEEARAGRFALVVSDLTMEELADAPERVKSVLQSFPTEQVERVSVTQECVALRDAYLNARVVGRASEDDALHIAIATVMAVDMVVSWNFKHIVHFEKIVGFEGVNTLNNYRSPRIYSPREVIEP